MKTKINYYLFRLLKENAVHLVSLIFIVTVMVVGVVFFIERFSNLQQKITLIDKEIVDLQKKSEFVSYKQQIVNEGIDLPEVNKILTQLLPNEEDFFTVISALEKISKDTNFLMTSYAINLKATKKDQLALTVEGQGDDQAFFNFLKDYRYLGGRLITLDKIDYKTTGFAQIRLNINFYSGMEKASANETAKQLSSKDKKLISEIMSKVKINLVEDEATSYPTKANPF